MGAPEKLQMTATVLPWWSTRENAMTFGFRWLTEAPEGGAVAVARDHSGECSR
jgi:hypothetical protein